MLIVPSSRPPTTPMEWALHAVEFSPDGVLIVGSDGSIVYANTAMQELVGTSDSLVGRAVEDLVPDAVRGHHAHLRSSYLDSPTVRPMGTGLELSLRRSDGRETPVEIALSPFDDRGTLRRRGGT